MPLSNTDGQMRLKKIDDRMLLDHSYLTPSDLCFYIGEYTAGGGYACSPTNQRIFNLKKKMSLQGTAQFQYKGRAIYESGADLRRALNIQGLISNGVTMVPVPPSKARGTPEHDDRMLQVLKVMAGQDALDVREIVLQTQSVDASHERSDRPTPGQIAQNYRINESLAAPAPRCVAIVDDVLTAGAHFKAMQMALEGRFPGVATIGIFLARRELQSQDSAD